MTAEQCKEMISKYNSAISGLSRVHRVVTGNGFLTKFDDVAPARNRSYLNPVNGGKARVLWGIPEGTCSVADAVLDSTPRTVRLPRPAQGLDRDLI